MARINIESCWWTDPRREKLGSLLGSMLLADAVIIRAWKIAQEFWGNERGLIPKHVFDTIEANAKLIQANLAEERNDGFYVRGSSQYLDWVTERRRAAREGGLKSAEKRSKKPKQTPTKRKQTQPSGSGSISDSDSNSESDSGNLGEAAAFATGVKETIAHYCDHWKARYHDNPPIRGKVAGQFKTLVKDHGAEQAKAYITAYLSMPDSWFVERRHDIATMMGSLNKVVHFIATGKVITKKQIQTLEEKVDDYQGTEEKQASISEHLAKQSALQPGGNR